MRLTRSDKDAFVLAVLDDVPKIDYNEQVRSLMNKWGREALPPLLQQVFEHHRGYLRHLYISTPYGCTDVNVNCPPDWCYNGFEKMEPEKYAQLEKIGELNIAQNNARTELESKVRGLIETCSTLKVARERLPEFEKYLPADRGGSGLANLPVSNTVADLMAAGWPKDKEVAACPS